MIPSTSNLFRAPKRSNEKIVETNIHKVHNEDAMFKAGTKGVESFKRSYYFNKNNSEVTPVRLIMHRSHCAKIGFFTEKTLSHAGKTFKKCKRTN